MAMTDNEKATVYSTRNGMPYTFDELAEFATYVYGLDEEEARSLIRLSAYLSQRMVPYRPITGEDISEAAERIMIPIKRSIEEALRGLPSTDKYEEKSIATKKDENMAYNNCTQDIYCEHCDSTNRFEVVDLYVCNMCQCEFDTWSDYCPECDRESRIEYCGYRCKKCNRYIPEVVC